jgi:predicted transcriptional regulator
LVTTKTTVYLPDDLKAGITREARRRGVAEAEVIRDALAQAVGRPAATGGLFHAEPIAERVDELLDGFGEQ